MLRVILQAIVLGIVQGVAEFAPISSSAHLIIVPWLFGWTSPLLSGLAFDVALHLGTLAAVVIYFRQDLWNLLRAGLASVFQFKIGGDPNRKLAWLIVLATIPAVIVGFYIEDTVDAVFHPEGTDVPNAIMLAIAAMLAAFGVIMYFADRLARHERPLTGIRLVDALLVGLAQTLALFPGVSRSGATITAGLALGFKRDVAARFSFLLSVPVTLGAGLKGLVELLGSWQDGALGGSDLLVVAAGVLAAGISGYLCIHFLLQYLRTRSITVFVIYRFAVAALVVAVVLMRM
jgi:undecaprenyl-diphosphatase